MTNKTILVYALDAEGHELNTPFHEGEETLKAARAEAKRLLTHPDYLADGLDKVEIRVNGQVHQDFFVKHPNVTVVSSAALTDNLSPKAYL